MAGANGGDDFVTEYIQPALCGLLFHLMMPGSLGYLRVESGSFSQHISDNRYTCATKCTIEL